jgi:hypothetical protein
VSDSRSSGDEPTSRVPDAANRSAAGADETGAWSGEDFEPAGEPPTGSSDEPPTTLEPFEQKRTMAREELRAWSMETRQPPTALSPWSQPEDQYTQRLQPPPPFYPPQYPPPPPKSPGKTIAIAVAVVAAIAVIVVVAVIAMRGGSKDKPTAATGTNGAPGKSAKVTKCATPPSYSMTDAKTSADGLTVKLRVKASCPGGDVLASPNTTIAIATSDGRVDVASGRFDLSANPVFVPRPDDGAVEYRFVFGADDYWMPLGMLDDRYTVSSPGYRIESSESGSAQTTSGTAKTSSTGTFTATGPGRPIGGNADAAAGNALRAIADSDTPAIQRELEGRWIPQLSSKKPGDFWDGIHWDNAAILREHLGLRQKFDNVRLTWSNEWSTYTITDMWVTSVGVTFPTGEDALGWCTSNGFDRDHCYAKIISKTMPAEGTTKLLP